MTTRSVADMTQRELEAIIFDGAKVNEYRSSSQAFTADEIYAILDAPVFAQFDDSFQSWMYNAFEVVCLAD